MNLLAIDIGNTFSKVVYFQGESLHVVGTFPTTDLEAQLSNTLDLHDRGPILVAWVSVAQEVDIPQWDFWKKVQHTPVFHEIKSTDPLPIHNKYKSPETLGADRIVAVIGARSLCPDKPVLVIDAGTAITYDVADAQGNYWGGAISPGLRMRFQALHTFTSRLPMVKEVLNPALTGNTTRTSIRSGVINGLGCEMEGMILAYKKAYGDGMQVFFTGGDMDSFENQLKNINFADQYLIHRGIRYTINKIYE